MPKKSDLIKKLFSKQIPKNFSMQELDYLMGKCNCDKQQGGRGSSIKYRHIGTNRILQFDKPHPGNNLYSYHIKMVKKFLEEIGEKE